MDKDLIAVGRRAIELEAMALTGLVQTLDENFSKACEQLHGCQGTILVTGMGKSGLVARKWASTFAGTGTRAYFLNAAEASHGDLGLVRESDIVIALSLSGETDELSVILRHCREAGIPTIGVTGNLESSLAKQASLVLSLDLPREACPLGLAPTTSTTLMMALGDAIAVTLMEMDGFTEKDFARIHPGGTLGRRLWLRVSELMHQGDALPIVDPEAPFEEVLLEITHKRLGCAVVIEGNAVVGLITDGDLRRYFQKSKNSVDIKARDLMTENPKSVLPTSLAGEAREIMEAHKIQQLLICEDRNLVGVIHMHDLLRAKVV